MTAPKPKRWKIFRCPKCDEKIKVLTHLEWYWDWCPGYMIKVKYIRVKR